MFQSKEWYGSLYSDLWEGILYENIVTHIQELIAIADTIDRLKRINAILFAILRIQTVLTRGTGLSDLEESLCGLAELLSAGGFYFREEDKEAIAQVLIKNAVPVATVERIVARIDDDRGDRDG